MERVRAERFWQITLRGMGLAKDTMADRHKPLGRQTNTLVSYMDRARVRAGKAPTAVYQNFPPGILVG